LKGIRDNEVRRKAALLITVLEAKNISEGCKRAGLVRNTFYDWIKRLKASEFSLLELKNNFRRPHQSPRTPQHNGKIERAERKRTGMITRTVIARGKKINFCRQQSYPFLQTALAFP